MTTASIGLELGMPDFEALSGLWLRRVNDETTELWDVAFIEDRPDLGEIKRSVCQSFMRVPTDAADALCPSTNFPHTDCIHKWRVWRHEAVLHGTTLPEDQPVAVNLESPPRLIIRPALMNRAGEVDVIYITGDGKRLNIVRFTPPTGGRPAAGSIITCGPCPDGVVGASATLTPIKSGSDRRVALISATPDRTLIHLADLKGGAAPAKILAAAVPGFVPAPNCSPAIRADPDGSTVVSALVLPKPTSTELSVAEIKFNELGAPLGDPKIEPLASLPAPILAGTVGYRFVTSRPMIRNFAVLLANASLWHKGTEEEPMTPRGIPASPLQLLVCRHCTYFVSANPVEGLILEATA